MRPYRGKTKEGKWVHGWCVKGEHTYIITKTDFYNAVVSSPHQDGLNHMSTCCYEVLPETVGQSIGLKDKNDKRDLYGGDRIVIGKDRGVLVWDEYDLCWALQLDCDDDSIQAICRYYTDEEKENIEYLGTIHDNPDLLKK